MKERFQIDEIPADTSDTDEMIKLMEAIGRKRGALLGGGRIDYDKVSMIVLRELRAGKLGRISLETP